MFELKLITDWYYWKPKKGRYQGKTIYVCLISGRHWYPLDVIISYEHSKKHYGLNMHTGQITEYQWNHNCEKIYDEKLLKRLKSRFTVYRIYWKEMKIKKEAKSLLMGNKYEF